MPSERGLAQNHAENHREPEENPCGKRKAEERRTAQGTEHVVAAADRPGVRHIQRKRTVDRKRAERRNERRHFAERDDRAVHCPAQNPDSECHRKCREDCGGGVRDLPHKHDPRYPCKRKKRADRKVDPSGDNHKRHAERHDPRIGNLPRDVDQILRAPEMFIGHHADDQQRRKRQKRFAFVENIHPCPFFLNRCLILTHFTPVAKYMISFSLTCSFSRTPATVPSRMTATLRQSPMISSRSDDMIRHAIPCRARPLMK